MGTLLLCLPSSPWQQLGAGQGCEEPSCLVRQVWLPS